MPMFLSLVEPKQNANYINPFICIADNVLESSYDLWELSGISKILGQNEDAILSRDKAFKYVPFWKIIFWLWTKTETS